jgi:hypothetical protein
MNVAIQYRGVGQWYSEMLKSYYDSERAASAAEQKEKARRRGLDYADTDKYLDSLKAEDLKKLVERLQERSEELSNEPSQDLAVARFQEAYPEVVIDNSRQGTLNASAIRGYLLSINKFPPYSFFDLEQAAQTLHEKGGIYLTPVAKKQSQEVDYDSLSLDEIRKRAGGQKPSW